MLQGTGPSIVVLALALALPMPALARPSAAVGSVRDSPHDLSRRLSEVKTDDDSCAYCHTPHIAGVEGPLWNIQAPVTAYRTYESQRTGERMGQPGGSSKLCLSCHDGLIAPIARRLPGKRDKGTKLERPKARLGADLSNSHPVSMPYDVSTARQRWTLRIADVAASGLGRTVRSDLLDTAGNVQCTSCHDAHGNRHGNFLVQPATQDRLCTTCHAMRGYEQSAHAWSSADPRRQGCATCHAAHGAAPNTTMLKERQPQLCGSCHPQQVAATASAYRSHGGRGRFDQREVQEVTCSTCHEPHTVLKRVGMERQLLGDLRYRTGQPRLLNAMDTPYNGMMEPLQAHGSSPAFCLSCHDGTWPGATNILAEIQRSSLRYTDFAIGGRNLHTTHTSRRMGERAACTYCHDAHGTPGTMGVQRGALLYPWLNVRSFPYTGRRSCSSNDPLGKCH